MKYFKKIKNKIFNLKFYFIIMIVLLNSFCYASYGKSINLNGIKITFTTNVTKRNVGVGVSVKEDNRFSEKKEKEVKDEYVKVELTVLNNNLYETANLTITEKVNSGFIQTSQNKNDKKISLKLDSKKEKKYNYNYKYQKNTVLNQLGKLISGKRSVEESESSKVNNIEELDMDEINEESNIVKKKDRTIKIILIILLVLIVGGSAVIVLVSFIKYLTDKPIDFDDMDNVKNFIIFLCFTFIISLINKNYVYASNYIPVMYEKGESYNATITESVLFNDRYYDFSYEINLRYDNKNEITDFDTDTDGDGLEDGYEYLYMTDMNNVDTDGDGLSDFMEVMVLNYNPNRKWTFNDGRNDSYRDYDSDGINNKKELELGTDLTNYDTDFDNLTDYEEVNGIMSLDGKIKYYTNPLAMDSDEDGINDDIEIKLGLNPTNKMTDGINLDSDKKIEQNFELSKLDSNLTRGTFPIINVSGKITGLIEDNLKIVEYSNPNFKNAELNIGNLIHIELKNNTDSVKISVDCTNYGDRVKRLIFIKYEDNEILPITTTITNNIITAELYSGEYGIADTEMVLRKLNIYWDDYES